jgi:hypothetical protein
VAVAPSDKRRQSSAVLLAQQPAVMGQTVTFYDGDTPITVQFDEIKPTRPRMTYWG